MTHQADLERAIQEAVRFDRDVRALHEVLAKAPAGATATTLLEEFLRDAMSRRDAALQDVGRALLGWTTTGGVVQLLAAVSNEESAPVVESPTVQKRPQGGKLLKPAVDEAVRLPAPPPPPPTPLAPPPVGAKATAPASIFKAYADPIPALSEEYADRMVAWIGETFPADSAAGLAMVERTLAGFDLWGALPKSTQRAVVGLCAAMARHLQDGAGVNLNAVFSALTSFSADARPGFVYGLARDHVPYGASWLADANLWWQKLSQAAEPSRRAKKQVVDTARQNQALANLEDAIRNEVWAAVPSFTKVVLSTGLPASDPRLLALVMPHMDLMGEEGLRAVRRAVQKHLEEQESTPEEQEDILEEAGVEETASPSCPLAHLTRGRRAAIVGGDARPEVQERVKTYFEFSEVEWVALDVRRIESLARQVRQGTVDVVILLVQFSSHSAQYTLAPACKEVGAAFALVPRGYGLAQISAAVEREVSKREP